MKQLFIHRWLGNHPKRNDICQTYKNQDITALFPHVASFVGDAQVSQGITNAVKAQKLAAKRESVWEYTFVA